MFGAVYGDIIGSYYENHCTKDYDFEFQKHSTFTDDTVMTCAVCSAILANPETISRFQIKKRALEYAVQYKQYYSRYPHAGYGQMFQSWAKEKSLISITKQRSFANGGAMRAVPIGYAYDDLKQVLLQTEASCYYTHHHREAVTGAKAVSSAVWLARHGYDKNQIRDFIMKKFRYDLHYHIDDIREYYVFDSGAEYSVPPSVTAFLDSHDYESAVRNAVSLGGDADTMACIAGGIAEAFYHDIPAHIRKFCDARLDISLRNILKNFERSFCHEEI